MDTRIPQNLPAIGVPTTVVTLIRKYRTPSPTPMLLAPTSCSVITGWIPSKIAESRMALPLIPGRSNKTRIVYKRKQISPTTTLKFDPIKLRCDLK